MQFVNGNPIDRFACVERFFNHKNTTANSTILREITADIVRNQLLLRPSKSNIDNDDCLMAECARLTGVVQHAQVRTHHTVRLQNHKHHEK